MGLATYNWDKAAQWELIDQGYLSVTNLDDPPRGNDHMGTSTIIRIDPVMDDWLLIVEREKPDFFCCDG